MATSYLKGKIPKIIIRNMGQDYLDDFPQVKNYILTMNHNQWLKFMRRCLDEREGAIPCKSSGYLLFWPISLSPSHILMKFKGKTDLKWKDKPKKKKKEKIDNRLKIFK